jgi:hypothetical protein
MKIRQSSTDEKLYDCGKMKVNQERKQKRLLLPKKTTY